MKKSIIIIILIVGIYLFLAIYGFDYIDAIFHKNIYIGDTRWEYSNGKWIDSSSKISNGLKLSNYYIYKQNTWEYVGRYDMKYNNNWYIRSKNGYAKYNFPLFAYKGSGIKLYNFDTEYNVDKSKVNAILKKANISKYSSLNLSKSIKFDVDNDGLDETIYVLSNVYSQNEEPILFSIVALEDNGEYKIIKSITKKEEEMLNIFAIIDVDGDKNLELVIAKEIFSCGNTYELYGLKDGKYVKLISTE